MVLCFSGTQIPFSLYILFSFQFSFITPQTQTMAQTLSKQMCEATQMIHAPMTLKSPTLKL